MSLSCSFVVVGFPMPPAGAVPCALTPGAPDEAAVPAALVPGACLPLNVPFLSPVPWLAPDWPVPGADVLPLIEPSVTPGVVPVGFAVEAAPAAPAAPVVPALEGDVAAVPPLPDEAAPAAPPPADPPPLPPPPPPP